MVTRRPVCWSRPDQTKLGPLLPHIPDKNFLQVATSPPFKAGKLESRLRGDYNLRLSDIQPVNTFWIVGVKRVRRY